MPDIKKIIEQIKNNDKTLTNIDLYDKKITDDDVIEIANLLPTNNTIRSINLGKNQITDRGAIALAEALGINTALRGVTLHSNKISNKSAPNILKALKLNHFIISFDLQMTDIKVSLQSKIMQQVEKNRGICHQKEVAFSGVAKCILNNTNNVSGEAKMGNMNSLPYELQLYVLFLAKPDHKSNAETITFLNNLPNKTEKPNTAFAEKFKALK